MNTAIGTVLTVALVAALGWWLGTLLAVWRNRPLVMWDHRTKHWRAYSLLGTKWRTKHHGRVTARPRSRSTLERRPAYSPRLERTQPLERPWNPDPLVDTSA